LKANGEVLLGVAGATSPCQAHTRPAPGKFLAGQRAIIA
jgi:hypothetical protein